MGLLAGDILRLYVQSLRNPKHKYCVLACLEPRALLLLINSELTDYKQSQPDLMASQIEIDATSHSCLNYDSWLDCAESHYYDRDQLETEFGANRGIVVGHLSTTMQARVVDVVRRSRTLSKRDIERILGALAPPR
ncbi:MAG: hypothetical protein HIU85_19335 [Proteobacteria bacterium]|nr:hypothetical protein [Pseudomonadota bacterium]